MTLPEGTFPEGPTELMPMVAGPWPGPQQGDPPATPSRTGDTAPIPRTRATSIGRSSGVMAVANLVSRITGFLRQVVLVGVLGVGVLNDAYTVSNTLPNIVYELLFGGVLTSVMIPILVRAQREDADGGETYIRRLLTLAGAALLVGTALAVLAAPLLTRLYLGGQSATANPALATALAYLLLPQILFYGLGALLGAVLNTRGSFGAFAWAPVLNNVVVLLVLGAYALTPGEISLDPVRMGDPKLLVLGIGTTLGIVAQALVLLPALRRSGFSYRPRWGWDARLSSAGGLVLWVVAYVLIGIPGYMVTTRVAAAADPGGVTIYSNAWLLLQVPYGVLGVSLLTALMPRMSRAAADGRLRAVVDDLALGSRLSAVFLVPLAVLLTVFGVQVGVALFGLRSGNLDGAARIGAAVACSAFGLLPYAITMLQLRVFYAMTDSRTPTLIQLFTVAVKIPLLLVCPLLLPPREVVLGLAAANGLAFVAGAALGQVLLRRRLGRIPTLAIAWTTVRTLIASLVGALVAWGVVAVLPLDGMAPLGRAWAQLGVAAVIATPLTLLGLHLLRITELDPLLGRVERLVDRVKHRRRTRS
ncbi:MAG TPA: murein biosynthesis integral membrane protein MurJ [Pseudonocardia sp.]